MVVTDRSQTLVRGRDEELAALDAALDRASSSHGTALVLLAESGMGKTTLLTTMSTVATAGWVVLDTAGVESESRIPLAGLHRLLLPLADRIPTLPRHHAATLAKVVTDGAGHTGDAFALYTAVHRLIADAAGDGPVLCRVDDAHRVDRVSVEALAFAARRLATEPVLTVFAIAEEQGEGPLAGIPRLPLTRLDVAASRQVLADHLPHGVPDDLAEDLIELASGNPLALVELVTALTPAQRCGDVAGPSSLPPGSRLRALLLRRFLRLSADARRLVVLAAVDDRLDVDTVVRIAANAGIDLQALEEARASGLVRLDGEHLEAPNPLVRSTLRAGAPLAERQAAHRLLASILDPEQHRLRWTLHRVATAAGPRDRLADELADAASTARTTGDYAGSSRAFQRAATLTAQPEVRALRLIAAATDCSLAGRTRHARALLRQARPLASSNELCGLTDLLHGEIELRDGRPALANQILLSAASELAGSHRTLGVTALMLAGEASCLAGNYQEYMAVARRAAGLRRAEEPPATQLMFDHFAGMAATYAARHAEAVEPLRRVVRMAESTEHAMSKIWASDAAYALGDAVVSQELATQAVGIARSQGFSVLVPWALVYLSMAALLHDRHLTAMSSSLEGMRVAGAIGQQNCVVDHLTILALVAALLGDRETALLRLGSATGEARKRGLGRPSALSSWAVACADLADDRPADAMNRLRSMAAGTGYLHPAIRVLAAPHFVEAAVRCGERAKAAQALQVFDQWANTTGSTPRLAQSHRCHALLAGGGAGADEHFREAIRLHRASKTSLELAKTELFYAHQLRRSRKPRAAREHLRDALKIFEQYGAEPWANRTRSELRAAGEAVAPVPSKVEASSGTATRLTPQQEQIARLVAEGATNREIAAQLVVSPRTVDHHLRNILAKLGLRSRVELAALFR